MNWIYVEATKVINARPADIYSVLSDYKVGHPAILPKPYFLSLEVEKGGVGEGTITRLHMKVMGKDYHYRQMVTEPEPGRVLVETDMETGQASWFTFDPVAGGSQTRLTISAKFPGQGGIVGVMEKFVHQLFTRKLFNTELDNIAAYMQQKQVV